MNKLTLLIISLFMSSSLFATDFITRWDMSIPGSNPNSISFGVGTTGIVSYTWETVPAGTSGSGTFSGNTATISGLPTNAVIRLHISNLNFNRINLLASYNCKQRLVDVEQWGSVAWSSMKDAFVECNNLNISSTDIPDLALVDSMTRMFGQCYSLNGPLNINSWNTGNVKDMSIMFSGTHIFNQQVGNWNTANVTNMSAMFMGAFAFNQPIGNWNTANVTNMSYMFHTAFAFNHLIGNWNTANVTNMSYIFYRAYAFNQPIGNWNTANLKDMSGMFFETTSFNQPIGNWNTSNDTNMVAMFRGATNFNQPIGNWNTANVTNMAAMFHGATNFNQPIGNWNTSNVTDIDWMFYKATSFNQPIGNWNTSNVIYMGLAFDSAIAFNQPIGGWNTSNVIYMYYMFENATSFNQPIGGWNTSNVISMSNMFENATSFNQPLGSWNTSNVERMTNMFDNATSFNQNIGNWNLSSVDSLDGLIGMLDFCGMDCSNYSATLLGWGSNPATPVQPYLGANTLHYGSNSNVVNARNYLISTKSWNIYGDTLNNSTCCINVFNSSSATSCNSFSFNGQTVTSTGVYYDTLVNSNGCDSLLELNLTIDPNINVTQAGANLTSNATSATYQWLSCPSYSPLVGETNQNFTAKANGDYAVVVTVNGCTDTSICYTVIGIQEINIASSFSVYPNPVSNTLYIHSSTAFSDKKKEFYNAFGQLLFTTKSNEIDVATYSKGIYYLKCEQHVVKVVLE